MKWMECNIEGWGGLGPQPQRGWLRTLADHFLIFSALK